MAQIVSRRTGRRWRAPLGVLGLLVVLALGAPAAAQEAAVPAGALADVRPAVRDEVVAAAGELSSYRIVATLNAATGTIAGTMRARYVNDDPGALGEVYFRLYPNAAHYGEGGLVVAGVWAGGVEVAPVLEVGETALRVPLPAPLAPDEAVTIDLAFAATVPADSGGSFGIYSRVSGTGTWVLADWHPVLAVHEAEAGWRIDPPTKFGDPTYAASAYYDVELTAPAGWRVATSGSEMAEEARGGAVARRYVAGPAREFTMVVDDDAVLTEAEVGGTTVRAWTEPAEAAAGQAAIEIATRSLTEFGRRYGAYPFEELDLVQTPLSGALAVSWAGIVFLDGPTLLGEYAAGAPEAFETVVAHEVAHLWWGASVGVDSNDHAFMNEGLATYASIEYQGWTEGEAARAAAFEDWAVGPAWSLLEEGDAVVDLPARDEQDMTVRSWAVYGKATLGFVAIREAIGAEAFEAGLRAYAEEWAYGIAEPADLRAAWEASSGQDLDELWRHWFEAAELTAAEIEALAA